jgi:predicted phosphodiesterase
MNYSQVIDYICENPGISLQDLVLYCDQKGISIPAASILKMYDLYGTSSQDRPTLPSPVIKPLTNERVSTDVEDVIKKHSAFLDAMKSHAPKHQDKVSIDLTDVSHPIAITGLSDLHYGSTGLDEERLVKDLKIINQTEGMFAVLLGDLVQNFVKKKLMHAGMGDVRPQYQWSVLTEILKTCKQFYLLMCGGNHDLWTKELTDIDMLDVLAEKLNVTYEGHGGLGFVYFDFKDVQYKGVFKHIPIGKSKVNPMLGTKRIYDELEIYDFAITGHIHRCGIEYFERHGLTRVALACGSYKVKDPFAQKYGFAPARPIMPTIILMPDRREMIAVESVETAAEILNALKTQYRN